MTIIGDIAVAFAFAAAALIVIHRERTLRRRAETQLRESRDQNEARIGKRTAEVSRADVARRTSDERSRLENQLRDLLMRHPGDEMYANVLDLLLKRFDSRFGFFGYIRNLDGALVCPSMTRDIWEQCAVKGKSIEFPRSLWGGLWGRILTERQPLLKNTAHTTPEGHVPLFRSMGAPLLVDGELVGSIHLANRAIDYTPADLELLNYLCGILAPTLKLRLERDKADEALKASEQRFREIFHTANVGIALADKDRRLTDANETFCAMLGYSPEEFRQLHTMDLVHPDDAEGSLRMAEEVRAGVREVHRAERRYLRKDGSIVWVDVSARRILDQSGLEKYSLAVISDITERKWAEQKLQNYAIIVATTTDLMAYRDADNRYVVVNDQYCKYFNKSFHEIIGHTPGELFRKDQFENSIGLYSDRCLHGETVHAENWIDYPGAGHRCMELHYHPFRDAMGAVTGIVVSARDITERKQAEDQVKGALQRLSMLSDHLLSVQEEDRRTLAYELHDEVGQSLTAAKIHLQAMQQALQDSPAPPALEHLDEALLAIAMSLERVRNMSLDLRPMLLDHLGLEAALRSLVERQAAAAGWNVRFEAQLRDARFPPNLELACFRVAQEAVTNIMRHAAAKDVWLALQQGDHELCLTVRDNGSGFDSATIQSASGWRSLGLLGMEERVKKTSGRLEIQAQPGAGTRVCAIFPIAPVNSGTIPGPGARR
ncbi:MAG: PAS domain S-box protein [Gammaproteobacteria bacterium]|nr:PAS domain S-box protein [Gammaproteobacteria bacterium]